MEIDTPSLNETGRLPVLDLGLFVQNNKIKTSFYSKPMSSPFTIHFRSAISKRIKRDTLLQEGIRRFRNMGPHVSKLEKEAILSKYMNILRISGYDWNYWYHMLRGILTRQTQLEEEIERGTRVRYRSRSQIQEAKSLKVGKHPSTWFLRGTVQNTLKVQGTPNSGLVNSLHAALGNRICTEGGSTKFVELGGKQLTSGLSGLSKFTAEKGCVFTPKCNVDPEHDCRATRSVYCVECTNCKLDPNVMQSAFYLGTSGHQLHKRQREHMGEVRNRRASNALFKHHSNFHSETEPNFTSRPIHSGIRFNLDRFIMEGHQINKNSLDENGILLNSRSEWDHRGIPRLQVNQN